MKRLQDIIPPDEEKLRMQQEIREITKFTCEYWWPQLVDWENSPERQYQTPLYGQIIRDTIEKRGRYVRMLEEHLLIRSRPNQ
jgi:hypothetical protein